MSPRSRADALLAPAAAALAGALFCLVLFGPQILDGGSIGWLMMGDRAQSFLGWHFYRREPETFPLGRIQALLFPIGASLAYADAIPWFSIALKPLSPLLPQVFQIAGLWLTLAFALQGWFACRVLELLTGDRAVAFAGSLIAIASPVLTFRTPHLALCAQWLILAAFYVFLRTIDDRTIGRFTARWAPLLILACGTHPYLAAMVVVIGLAACANGTPLARLRLRDRSTIGARPWIALVLARTALVGAISLASFYAFGYVGDPSIGTAGFGYHSANLLTLVDSQGLSRLFPDLHAGPGQYEGFGFLGVAPFVLLVAGAAARVARRRQRVESTAGRSPVDPLAAIRPASRLLAVALGAMAVFALSSHVLAGGVEIARARTFYAWFEPIPSAFRSSGRFIWPLHYALAIASVVWLATGVRRRSIAVAVCLGALTLQAWDSFALYTREDIRSEARYEGWNPLRSYAWLTIPDDYAEIRLIPPYVHDATCLPRSYPPYFYIPFAYLAGTLGLRVNSGHLSRQPTAKIEAACHAQAEELAAGEMAPDSVYVVSNDDLPQFRALATGVARCGVIDHFNVCVRADRPSKLADLLSESGPAGAAHPSGTAPR